MSVRDFANQLEKRLQGLLGPRRSGALSADLLAQVRAIVRGDVAERFAQARDPKGQPWRPLKQRRGRPLVLTGKLRKSALDMAAEAVVKRSFSGQGKYGVSIGLDTGKLVSYGLFQNDGTRRIPARPFVGVSEVALAEITGLLLKELEQQVRKELS